MAVSPQASDLAAVCLKASCALGHCSPCSTSQELFETSNCVLASPATDAALPTMVYAAVWGVSLQVPVVERRGDTLTSMASRYTLGARCRLYLLCTACPHIREVVLVWEAGLGVCGLSAACILIALCHPGPQHLQHKRWAQYVSTSSAWWSSTLSVLCLLL